jgi:hypothetical protein
VTILLVKGVVGKYGVASGGDEELSGGQVHQQVVEGCPQLTDVCIKLITSRAVNA